MADTYSQYAQLLLMQDGSHPNTWGDLTNTNLELIDQSMSQVTSVAVSNANFPLTNYQAAQSQARSLAFNVTGTLSAAVAIELPANYPRLYVFFNQVTNSGNGVSQYPLTVQVGTGSPLGTTVALSGPTTNNGNGVANLVYTDGTNVYGAQPPGEFASLNVYEAFTVGTAWTPVAVPLTGGPGYTGTIDTSKSNEFYITGPAGATSLAFTFANSGPNGQLSGQQIQVAVTQNGSGGMVPSWPSGVLWPNGVQPVFSTTPNATDLVSLTYTNVGGTLVWLGSWEPDYGAAGSTGGTYNVKISANATDVSVLGLIGAVSGSVTVNVTVNIGVTLNASSILNFGLDCSGLPGGSIVNLYNAGYITGCGGNGGPGIFWVGDASFGFGTGDSANPAPSSVGQPGGASINGPNGGTLNIYNTGHIWGGGGGGGGGGYQTATGAGTQCASGGGGGGAGGGIGGTAFVGGQSVGVIVGGAGTNGNIAPNASAAGVAGGGAGTGSHAGGNGGNWGAAGYTGVAPTSATVTRYNGLGGAAGAAVLPNGGTINVPISGDIQGTT